MMIDFSKAVEPSDKAKEAAKAAAKLHLQETDWYITRFVEIAEPVPAEVTASRAEARATLAK